MMSHSWGAVAKGMHTQNCISVPTSKRVVCTRLATGMSVTLLYTTGAGWVGTPRDGPVYTPLSDHMVYWCSLNACGIVGSITKIAW